MLVCRCEGPCSRDGSRLDSGEFGRRRLRGKVLCAEKGEDGVRGSSPQAAARGLMSSSEFSEIVWSISRRGAEVLGYGAASSTPRGRRRGD
jgi:hypothetical protein